MVYLNGEEVMRTNMPTGRDCLQHPGDDNSSLGGHRSFPNNVNPGLLVAGTPNVLAVGVHQSAYDSPTSASPSITGQRDPEPASHSRRDRQPGGNPGRFRAANGRLVGHCRWRRRPWPHHRKHRSPATPMSSPTQLSTIALVRMAPWCTRPRPDASRYCPSITVSVNDSSHVEITPSDR